MQRRIERILCDFVTVYFLLIAQPVIEGNVLTTGKSEVSPHTYLLPPISYLTRTCLYHLSLSLSLVGSWW